MRRQPLRARLQTRTQQATPHGMANRARCGPGLRGGERSTVRTGAARGGRTAPPVRRDRAPCEVRQPVRRQPLRARLQTRTQQASSHGTRTQHGADRGCAAVAAPRLQSDATTRPRTVRGSPTGAAPAAPCAPTDPHPASNPHGMANAARCGPRLRAVAAPRLQADATAHRARFADRCGASRSVRAYRPAPSKQPRTGRGTQHGAHAPTRTRHTPPQAGTPPNRAHPARPTPRRTEARRHLAPGLRQRSNAPATTT